MAVRKGVAAVAMAAVVALGLASCSDGAGDDPPAAVDSTASESPSASLTPTVPLPESTPSIEPATGPRLEVFDVRVNGLPRWQQNNDTPFVDTALGRTGSLTLSVKSTYGEKTSLRQAERFFWQGNGTKKPRGYRSRDSVVMGGLTASYYTYEDNLARAHVVTTVDSGRIVKVEVRFFYSVPVERHQELLDSIIASYESPRMRTS